MLWTVIPMILAFNVQVALHSAAPSEQPSRSPSTEMSRECRPDYGALNMDPDLCVPDNPASVLQ